MSEPGAEIHAEHPYAAPAAGRRDSRRFRGRLAGSVTLWTAGDGRGRAGLTVASTVLVDGDPPRLLGTLDPLSDLVDALADAGRFTVQLLAYRQSWLADQFAGLAPAPGGLFAAGAWSDSPWGPVLADAPGWLGCRVDGTAEMGWSVRVDATVDRVVLSADEPALVHWRGRYHRLGDG